MTTYTILPGSTRDVLFTVSDEYGRQVWGRAENGSRYERACAMCGRRYKPGTIFYRIMSGNPKNISDRICVLHAPK